MITSVLVALMILQMPAKGVAQTASSPVYDVPRDGRIGVVVEGRSIEVFADPGMPSDLYLSRRTAAMLFGPEAEHFRDENTGFKLLSFKPVLGAKIGPIRVQGQSRTVALTIGKTTLPTLSRWYERDMYDGHDALAGPYALPAPVVRFSLRPASATEFLTDVPLAGRRRLWSAATVKTIGGKDVLFAFTPQFETSVASAAAGAVIAGAMGGTFAGAVRATRITYGVDRPARPVKLAKPLQIGPIRLSELLVRTVDYGNSTSIQDLTARDPSESSGDIVVNGRVKGSRPQYIVYVGAYALQRCSSITYDKPAQRVTLACSAD